MKDDTSSHSDCSSEGERVIPKRKRTKLMEEVTGIIADLKVYISFHDILSNMKVISFDR